MREKGPALAAKQGKMLKSGFLMPIP